MVKETCGSAWLAWLVLIVGVLYLLNDLGMGLGFWNFQWYTIAFLLWGICAVTKGK